MVFDLSSLMIHSQHRNLHITPFFSTSPICPTLYILVTKRPRSYTHCVLHCQFRSQNSPVHRIRQCNIRTRRDVQKRPCAGKSVLSIDRIEGLPDCPNAVNLPVVQVEGRITGGVKYVAADGLGVCNFCSTEKGTSCIRPLWWNLRP